MCGIAAAALAASVIGGGVSAYQQQQVGQANAALARTEAAQTREIGRFNESRARDRMSKLIAQQRGQLVANGVQLDSTSAIDLGDQAAREMALEGQAQRFNTDSRATALTNEAKLQRYRGQMGFLTGAAQVGAQALSGSLKLWPDLAGA